jgi:hypothetical protein
MIDEVFMESILPSEDKNPLESSNKLIAATKKFLFGLSESQNATKLLIDDTRKFMKEDRKLIQKINEDLEKNLVFYIRK